MITASGWALAIEWLSCARVLTVPEGLTLAGCVFLIVGANAMRCDALDVDDDRVKGIRGIGP